MLNKFEIGILNFLKRHSIYSFFEIVVNQKKYYTKELQPHLDTLLAENLIIKQEKKYKITELGLKELLKYNNPHRIKLKIEEYKQNNKEINLSDIARELELTRQAVSYIVKKHKIKI
ncbi:MAG: MarR family transcriptional regulator [Candidatus Heimdallarchaeota archaeon]|nr:MarR family transcriptional regulator [Candidatus Heimdallarchaeota archaeon]